MLHLISLKSREIENFEAHLISYFVKSEDSLSVTACFVGEKRESNLWLNFQIYITKFLCQFK